MRETTNKAARCLAQLIQKKSQAHIRDACRAMDLRSLESESGLCRGFIYWRIT
jgi:hypothetical protein